MAKSTNSRTNPSHPQNNNNKIINLPNHFNPPSQVNVTQKNPNSLNFNSYSSINPIFYSQTQNQTLQNNNQAQNNYKQITPNHNNCYNISSARTQASSQKNNGQGMEQSDLFNWVKQSAVTDRKEIIGAAAVVANTNTHELQIGNSSNNFLRQRVFANPQIVPNMGQTQSKNEIPINTNTNYPITCIAPLGPPSIYNIHQLNQMQKLANQNLQLPTQNFTNQPKMGVQMNSIYNNGTCNSSSKDSTLHKTQGSRGSSSGYDSFEMSQQSKNMKNLMVPIKKEVSGSSLSSSNQSSTSRGNILTPPRLDIKNVRKLNASSPIDPNIFLNQNNNMVLFMCIRT